MLKPTMNLNELPEALRHTMLIELAHVFCRRLGRPRANDIEMAGFPDLGDLLLRGWILREPGRYSIGYQPGEPVIREMWIVNPTLCSLLRLPPPLVSRIPDVDDVKVAMPMVMPEPIIAEGERMAA
ncbi:MAG TPA: hypothetical protein VGH19_09335 [Verrucomicrobiae bacterium]